MSIKSRIARLELKLPRPKCPECSAVPAIPVVYEGDEPPVRPPVCPRCGGKYRWPHIVIVLAGPRPAA